MSEESKPTQQVNVEKVGKVEVNPPSNPTSFLDSWPNIFKMFLQFGFAGVFIWVFLDNQKNAREDHKEAFQQMREDNVRKENYDREMRSKSNAIMREGNATLKEINTDNKVGQKILIEQQVEMRKMVGAVEKLIQKMPNP